MSDHTHLPAFKAEIRHRVHEGLTLDVDLAIDDECVVLFGPSGAGKTSLLRLIAGLVRPDSATIRLGGDPLCETEKGLHRPIRKRGIGYIFQHDLLFPHRDVSGNIRFGLKGWGKEAAIARVAEVAELCGVSRLLGRDVATLSGGERQRVGLARALAPRPQLLLADEPLSALDLASRDLLIDRLRDARRGGRIPMLYVTHAPAEAIALGDRLLRLDAGRIVAEGRPLDVLAERPGRLLDGLRNVFRARIARHDPGATTLELLGGPELIVAGFDRPVGSRATVSVRADDILLADPAMALAGLSAQNRLRGTIERIIRHGGHEAEVIVQTGALRWIVAVIAAAVDAMSLHPGSAVDMIVKARSCHVADLG